MGEKRAIKGRIAQVDICPEEAGYVLSIGQVSLWLQLDEAQDVMQTLKRALAVEAERKGFDPGLAEARHPGSEEAELTQVVRVTEPPRSN